MFIDHILKDDFKLHELTEIDRQENDPEFAEVLSHIRLGHHTENIEFLRKPKCVIVVKAIVKAMVKANFTVCMYV